MQNLITLLLFVLVLCGCDKRFIQEDEIVSKPTVRDGILKFNTLGDYSDFTENIDFSDPNSVKSLLKDYKFKSHGLMADEIYFSQNFESFENEQKFYEFQRENNNFVGIYQSDDYGLTIDVKFFDHINRYLYNEDRLLIIGDKVRKIFENGVLIAELSDIEVLKSIQRDFYQNESISHFDFRPIVIIEEGEKLREVTMRDPQNICPSYEEDRKTNGRNRTYLRVRLDHEMFEQLGLYRYLWKADYLARPYLRTLGIWYWAERTMTAEFKFAVSELDGVWNREICTRYYAPQLRYSISGDLCRGEYYCPSALPCLHRVHFDAYDCWADTPSTDPSVTLKCNEHLF